MKSYEFIHTTSSPHYPQANGEVERAVETVKALLKKGADPYQALLNYRNTPLEGTHLSPAQLLMGRRLKTSLPTTTALLRPPGSSEIKHIWEKRKEKEKQQYDKHCGRELAPLHTGDVVRIQHGKQSQAATVLYRHPSPRSYVVQATDGTRYHRNRRHLHFSRAPTTMPKEDMPAVNMRPVGCSMDTTSNGVIGSRETSSSVQPQSRSTDATGEDQPSTPCEPSTVVISDQVVVKTRSGRQVKPPQYLKLSVESDNFIELCLWNIESKTFGICGTLLLMNFICIIRSDIWNLWNFVVDELYFHYRQ